MEHTFYQGRCPIILPPSKIPVGTDVGSGANKIKMGVFHNDLLNSEQHRGHGPPLTRAQTQGLALYRLSNCCLVTARTLSYKYFNIYSNIHYQFQVSIQPIKWSFLENKIYIWQKRQYRQVPHPSVKHAELHSGPFMEVTGKRIGWWTFKGCVEGSVAGHWCR